MAEAKSLLDLVPGRECGQCTVCCYALPIDTPEMRKASGAVCEHCNGRGCSIYATRPANCREYYCGWRALPVVPQDWRPDLCGVLVSPQNENIPPDFVLREGIEFMLLGGEAAVVRPGFAEFVASLIAARVPVFLAVPGPVGTVAARTFANHALAQSVANRDRAGLVNAVLAMLARARNYPFAPDVFQHGSGRAEES